MAVRNQRAVSEARGIGRRIDAVEHALARLRTAVVRGLWLRRNGDSPRSSKSRRRRPALDERRIMAVHHERALRRVAEAAHTACEDWSLGLDVDEAMSRLQAELRTAAEFES
jgi:hypothetical protein